jgi:hypothetical protein
MAILKKGFLYFYVVLVTLFLALQVGITKEDENPIALDIIEEVKSISQQFLWPGFNPLSYPLVIYDGENTYLFNHPNPPKEFMPVEGLDKVWKCVGQFGTIPGNTVIKISDTPTAAILMETMKDLNKSEIAAVAIHEIFHVFQMSTYPEWWKVNELEFFTYPFENIEILTLKKLETEAFRRAIQSKDEMNALRWSKAALGIRRERFEKMKEGSILYECGIELLEGTAHYIQYQIADKHLHTNIKEEGYLPEDVRLRGYALGNALCLLLDHFKPSWKEEIKKGEQTILHELLENELLGMEEEPYEFSKQEKEDIFKKAQMEVEELISEKKRIKNEFLSQPGWQIIISTVNEPLWPKGFDPMNLQLITDSAILHKRWLKLCNNQGCIEIINHKSITEPMGDHPLFQGVKKVTVAGLDKEPAIEKVDDKLSLKMEGINLQFEDAEMQKTENCLIIKLAKKD